ncbi:unnamed protein product [Musa banksii]
MLLGLRKMPAKSWGFLHQECHRCCCFVSSCEPHMTEAIHIGTAKCESRERLSSYVSTYSSDCWEFYSNSSGIFVPPHSLLGHEVWELTSWIGFLMFSIDTMLWYRC